MDGTEYLFFKLIIIALRGMINTSIDGAYARVLTAMHLLALAWGTTWVMISGYQILAGTNREPMMEMVFKGAKMGFIVAILSAGDYFGLTLRQQVNGVRDDITQAITSAPGSVYTQIDGNLRTMNLLLNVVDAVDSAGDTGLEADKTRATTMALVGQASPAMVGGILSILNEIAVGLGIVFCPVFLVALMFKQTASMFLSWLKYMITAFFTMGVLAMVVGWCTQLSGLYIGTVLTLTFLAGDSMPSLQTSMAQAGLGLVLSVLMITVPGIVGTFFGTSMTTLEPRNVFNASAKKYNNTSNGGK